MLTLNTNEIYSSNLFLSNHFVSFYLSDSHAILIYLIEKYAKNDDLYPKNDILLKTKIHEILFYEASWLFARIYEIAVSLVLALN